METNPYTTPSANLFGSTGGTSAEGVPQEAITQLQRTKPWVRLIGVLLWISVVFMLLGGVSIALVGIVGMSAVTEGPAAGQAGAMIGMAVAYAILALLYIYPAMKIWGYANSIGRLVTSRSPVELVAALNQQRSFWKFVGLISLISIIISVLAIIGIIAFGAAMGLGNLPTATEGNP